MINKISPSIEVALADVRDGSSVMIGGFGGAGQPAELIDGLINAGKQPVTLLAGGASNLVETFNGLDIDELGRISGVALAA